MFQKCGFNIRDLCVDNSDPDANACEQHECREALDEHTVRVADFVVDSRGVWRAAGSCDSQRG
jgi:hypothetical protein